MDLWGVASRLQERFPSISHIIPAYARRIFPHCQSLDDKIGGLGVMALRALLTNPNDTQSIIADPAIDEMAQLIVNMLDLQQATQALEAIASHSSHTDPLDPAAHSEDYLMHQEIDHTISRFLPGSPEARALRIIARHLLDACVPNPADHDDTDAPVFERDGITPYGDYDGSVYGDDINGPFLGARRLNYQPPDDPRLSRETCLSGVPQLSKTVHETVVAWVNAFVDGIFPVIGVRSNGGQNTGAPDMVSGIHALNSHIERIFREHVVPANILPMTSLPALLLQPVDSSIGQEVEFRPDGYLSRPQVLIVLSNATQFNKILYKPRSRGHKLSMFDTFKGGTDKCPSPYKPKVHDPSRHPDQGTNRPLCRIGLLLDEGDLCRTTSDKSAIAKHLYCTDAKKRKRLHEGLNVPVPVPISSSDSDSEDESGPSLVEEQLYIMKARQEQTDFRNFCHVKGLLCACRGVVIVTATPVASTHELPKAYHQAELDIISLEPPKNHVTYAQFAHPEARHQIETNLVPGRLAVKKLTIGRLYETTLTEAGVLNMALDAGYFSRVGDTLRCRSKRKIAESNELALIEAVHKAHQLLEQVNKSIEFRQKLDLPGIRDMLESMAADPTEPERRALILTSLTKTDAQKATLAQRLLADDRGEPVSVYDFASDLFVMRFSHKKIDIQWRGPGIDYDQVTAALDNHGLPYVDGGGNGPHIQVMFPNINHVYAALHEFASQQPGYKLRSVVIAGEIGGRGLNFKPSTTHAGYLTDMFAMFDVFKGRMTAHGEAWIQYLGRLATIVNRLMLERMERTPPRLWISQECWECAEVWFEMLPQYMDAVASRQQGETNQDAVARCIREDPVSNEALHTAMAQEVQELQPNKRGRVAENKLPLTRLRRHDEALAANVDAQTRTIESATFQFPNRVGPEELIDQALAQLNARAQVAVPTLVPVSGENEPRPQLFPHAVHAQIHSLDTLLAALPHANPAAANCTLHTIVTYTQRVTRLKNWGILRTLDDLASFQTCDQLFNCPTFRSSAPSGNLDKYAKDYAAAVKLAIRANTTN
jgi:hypothetical protein